MEAATTQRNWTGIMLRSDSIAAIAMVTILLVMLLPLPTMLLDIFLSTNITLALLIMVLSLYITRPLDFAIFPSVLLVTTLFRLSLNIASTRIILLHGDEGAGAAGSVIQSFGQFVVGGDYVVGFVVFMILVIINFVVITKGAGRIAEVSARFTLDAMPGKQMAIDADLNTGLIGEDEARQRRKEIAAEAEFHGSMDGASKFVRGDAIAGIIITLVNIVAGFVIGVMQKDMPMAEAAKTYTILTIGDGLVGQIPALIISTAAGLLVTRTAGDEDFGTSLKKQFSIHPRAIWIVAGILLAFALIPGLPFLPFLVLSALTGAVAFQIEKTRKEKEAAKKAAVPKRPQVREDDNLEAALAVDLLELEVGYGLIPFVDSSKNGELLGRIRSLRKQFALDMGFIVPPVHIKDNLQLKPNEYRIALKGISIATGEVMPDYFLAMDPGSVTETIHGIATTDPAFGLPAIWISSDQKERAEVAGYTVVDCPTVMATHVSEVIRQHSHELLGRQETQSLVDNVAKAYPKLVEDLIPATVSLGTVMRVLQNLLREDVSIRDLRTILETIADWAPSTSNPMLLTEYVRQAMARALCAPFTDGNDTMQVMTIAPELENELTEAVEYKNNELFFSLDPTRAQKLLTNIGEKINRHPEIQRPVLLCTPAIRPHLQRLIERYYPNMAVISHGEITPNLKIRSIDSVSIHAR